MLILRLGRQELTISDALANEGKALDQDGVIYGVKIFGYTGNIGGHSLERKETDTKRRCSVVKVSRRLQSVLILSEDFKGGERSPVTINIF